MRIISPLICLLVICGPLAFGSSTSREPLGQNLVILLIDGYGANLFNKTNAKLQYGAQTLLSQGVQAEYMQTVFPTQSYPNWFSLVTGLYVENHNFTSDFMYNSELDMLFQRDEGANDTDYRWWNGGPAPLWYTVGKAYIDVHCYWFATCHRPHVDQVVQVPHSRRHSFKSQEEIDLSSHLPKIMKHIKKYQAYRQQLVLLRYNGVANALRLFGEDSSEVNQALSNADVQIRKIQDELEANELFDSTNLIVVSDHGLKRIDEENQFYIEECLADLSRIMRVVNSMAFMMIYPEEGEEDTVFFELKVCDQWAPMGDYDENEAPLVSIFRQNEIPERYHWRNARFIGPIVLIARPGTVLLTRSIASTDVSEAQARELKMIGGWDNTNSDMHAIFLARGPAFKVDHKIGPIETVDVYQLALNVLGIEPSHPHNGTWENVEDVLSDGWETRKSESQNSAIRYMSQLSHIIVVSLSIIIPLWVSSA
jgi:predicted AlkP superfamily pyrophosphatase or phosphodiesterase